MTKDQFYEEYLFPINVRGVNLEDLECIRTYYKNLILECNTIPEMMKVAREFEFFATDALKALNKLSNFYIPHIKNQFNMLEETKDYEMDIMAPILVPHVMLRAHIIVEKMVCPEYVAGFQYVVATNFKTTS